MGSPVATRHDRGARRRAIDLGGRWRRHAGGAGGAAWIALLLFLGLCLLGGGSNLPSAPGLVVLRPASIFLVAAFLAMRARPGDAAMRVPILMLAAMTVSIAVQLIPLPPALWWRLPGRSELAGLSAILARDTVWRPLSLTPSLTLSSLLATLTSWVVVLAFMRMPRDRDRTLAGIIILMALASCLVGLLQLIGGSDGAFYLYKGNGSISGLLANRNHQATLLAMALPLLRLWTVGADPDTRLRRGALATLLGGVMLGMILLTGSRSGLVSALIGVAAAYAIAPERGGGANRSKAARAMTRWALIVLPVLLVAMVILAGRDLSIQRVFTADYAGEVRLRSLPTTMSLVGTYFPFGSGYGSFDTVFRIHEPDAILKPTFFNRAHNDFLELAITGGLFPLLLLAAAMVWAAWTGWGSFRRSWRQDGVLEARAGAIILLILTVASVSDYPVRTPLIAAVATIAVCWIARARGGDAAESNPRPDRRSGDVGSL